MIDLILALLLQKFVIMMMPPCSFKTECNMVCNILFTMIIKSFETDENYCQFAVEYIVVYHCLFSYANAII